MSHIRPAKVIYFNVVPFNGGFVSQVFTHNATGDWRNATPEEVGQHSGALRSEAIEALVDAWDLMNDIAGLGDNGLGKEFNNPYTNWMKKRGKG